MAPLASSGIEKLECDNLKLQCFQSRTGVKFVLTAEPGTPDLDNVLHGIYELYADYVLKVRGRIELKKERRRDVSVSVMSAC